MTLWPLRKTSYNLDTYSLLLSRRFKGCGCTFEMSIICCSTSSSIENSHLHSKCLLIKLCFSYFFACLSFGGLLIQLPLFPFYSIRFYSIMFAILFCFTELNLLRNMSRAIATIFSLYWGGQCLCCVLNWRYFQLFGIKSSWKIPSNMSIALNWVDCCSFACYFSWLFIGLLLIINHVNWTTFWVYF